ncbi:MAG: type II toxin-antitoxin system RelE/ParE family toxin [Anaerovoracaceae bacterium]|jgi:phage-related protein|nr:type II toxin-antitoxin system RelE/ParE family toxin [Anaerovoracaceae bacterium]
MKIYFYTTSGGKNLIKEYLDGLPKSERAEGYYILETIEQNGPKYLQTLNARQLDGKLWEIKFRRHNRMFYILKNEDKLYILHACKKQKNKTENQEINKARERAKEIL